MIVIMGESGSGKSTLQKMLVDNNPQYKKIVTYTTRPMRKNEKKGVDYCFISPETFEEFQKRDFFIETNKYRDWSYGTSLADCTNSDDSIVILTPAGFRALKRAGITTTSVYLYVDRPSRLINCLARGDDVEESYRRNLSDAGQFDGVVDEVDYVINNAKFHMNEEETLACLLKILNVSKGEKDV